MVGIRWLFVPCLILILSLSVVAAQTLLPRKYPSARVVLVIPGDGYQAPTDQEAIDILMGLYGRADADAVKLWESQFADLTSGGHTGVAAYNANHRATDYTYFQSIYTRLYSRDSALRVIALRNGWDYESFALHFKEDTYIDSNAIGFTDTVLYGKAPALAYVPTYSNYCSNPLGSNTTVLGSGSKNGLWVGVPEKVAEITIPITVPGDPGDTGQVVIEYVNAVDENFHITGWGQVVITYDGTNGFRQTGTIKWLPPTDWKWCLPNPPHSMGSTAIKSGAGCYIFRVRAVNFAVTPQIDTDQIKNQCLRQVLQLVTTNYRTGKVLSATSTTVRITTGPPTNRTKGAPKKENYYKDMTIEIISGTGAGQTRTITASTESYTPTLTVSPGWDIVPDTTSEYRITGPTVMVPGWDPANDTNGDGYVDDNEFSNRPNPNASARFRWEGRVTAGGGWSPSNGTCKANMWNAQWRQALVEYYVPLFQSLNVAGYDNDDAVRMVGYEDTLVLYGGRVWEQDGNSPLGWDDTINTSYRDAFLAAHAAMAQAGVQWRGTNISQRNMILSPFTRPYLQYFTFFRCEQTLMDSQPLLTYCGLLRNWKIPAYAAAGVRSVVQCQTAYSNFISYLGNTQEAWQRLTENKLAMFYLLNVPDYTFFQNWNRTYDYGSWNTLVGTSIRGFWKAGVPQNMAYMPVRMLQADIGEPANSIPGNYEPIEYILGDPVGTYGEYYRIGNSTQNTLTVPVQEGGTLQVPIVPTYAFYLWRTTGTTYGVPNDAVVARMYTKGMVLCRMPASSAPGGYASYIANAITVPLPGGPYRRVNYDGTLGPPVDEISIRGYEGIILVKAAQTGVPNIQLTMSVDKPNPRPLEVVTVTIEARNTGSGGTSNVEVRIPTSGMTYERGSLTPQEFTVDASDPLVLKVNIPTLEVGQSVTFQFRLVVR